MSTDLTSEPIALWTEGDAVDAYAFVGHKERRLDRNGRTFFQLELRDASGIISAFVWPDSPAHGAEFEAHDFVAVGGSVRRFRDDLQLTVRRIRKVTEMDRAAGFDETLLLPSSKENLDELWRRLVGVYEESVVQPLLSRLAGETLEEYREEIRIHPAAKVIHHAFRGGLLEHTTMMAELAVLVCGQYPEVDRDLVLLGVLFHDLGKITELGPMPANDYTKPGRFVGHVVLGRDLLRARCEAIPDFPSDLQLHLEHLVLSHQGKLEWGSPVEPMTAEAMVLHFVDNLDSKLAQLRQARDTGGGFRYIRSLGGFIWLGEDDPESSSPQDAD